MTNQNQTEIKDNGNDVAAAGPHYFSSSLYREKDGEPIPGTMGHIMQNKNNIQGEQGERPTFNHQPWIE